MDGAELRMRLETIEHEEAIDLIIALVGDDPVMHVRVDELIDELCEGFDPEDDLAEDDVAYDPGSCEREARERVEGIKEIWGWSYAPRVAALREMCEDLVALAFSVPARRRPTEAVNTMMAVLRVVFDHRAYQEEIELDGVAETVLMSVREYLAAGYPHRVEVLDELVAHVVEVLSSGSWHVYDGITDILREQLTSAEVSGLCDQLGDEVDALDPSRDQRGWCLDGVRRFCSSLAPELDLSEHLPER